MISRHRRICTLIATTSAITFGLVSLYNTSFPKLGDDSLLAHLDSAPTRISFTSPVLDCQSDIFMPLITDLESDKGRVNSKKNEFIGGIHFTPYRESWAILIGLNEYHYLDTTQFLRYAKNDVDSLRELLIDKYGFKRKKIFCLIDTAATKARIESAFVKLTNPDSVKYEDRVLVFYVGHGQTIPLASGEEMGFLIPYDALIELDDTRNPSPYFKDAIPMSRLREFSSATPAKHALFLIDACYSGLATTQELDIEDIGIPIRVSTPIKNLARQRTRQILTAGASNEKVCESDKWCHTAFAYKLLEGLSTGSADLSGDSVITGQELGIYISQTVPEIAPQTPQYSCLEGEGDFLLQYPRNTQMVVRPILMPEQISAPDYPVTALMFAVVAPGLVQFFTGYKASAWNVGSTGAEMVSISYLLYANTQYNRALQSYNIAREAYMGKTDNSNRDKLVKAHKEITSWRKRLSVAFGVTFAIYIFNLWNRINFDK